MTGIVIILSGICFFLCLSTFELLSIKESLKRIADKLEESQ